MLKGIIISFLLSLLFLAKQLYAINAYVYDEIYTLTGTSGHKNLYSSFILLTCICSAYSFFHFKKAWKNVALACFIIQVLLIVFLRSRAVWIGSSVGIIVYVVFLIIPTSNQKINKCWAIVPVVLLFLFFYAALPYCIDTYKNTFTSTAIEAVNDTGSLAERFQIWDKTYEVIKANPFVGVGAGNWKIAVTKYQLPSVYRVQDLNIIFQRPHNEFLRIIAEYGIVGFFLFIGFIGYFIWSLIDNLKNRTNKVLLAGFIGFLSCCFFSFPLERAEHQVVLMVIFLLISAAHKKDKHITSSHFNIPTSLLVVSSLAITFICFQQYKSAYYHKKMLTARDQQKHEEVIDYCTKELSLFSNLDDVSIPIHWYLGNANASLGRFKETLKDFKTAYQNNPYNPNVLNDLGSAYSLDGDIDNAIFAYELASEINPRFDDPKLNLTLIYISKGEYKLAQKWNTSILHDSERRSVYQDIITQQLAIKE